MSASYQNQTPLSCSLAVSQQDSINATLTTADELLQGSRTVAELLALGLEGLPSTRRGMYKLADRLGWKYVLRIGQGCGRAYDVRDLPQSARDDLMRRRLQAIEDEAGRVGRPRGTDFFARNADMGEFVIAQMVARRLATKTVRKQLVAAFADRPLPSLRTLQRFMARQERDRKATLESIRNPDGYKGKHRLALGRADGNVSRANEVWELDTTKADVMTLGGRKMILGLIDRYSRRANFMVCDSEGGQSVRKLLGLTMTKWRVKPEAVMTDNGSGFINASIVSALEALGIEHRICPPGSPEKKPHIERLFGSFTRERATMLEGFAGHSVADAQALRSAARKQTGRAVVVPTMPPEQLQAILDAWLDGEYHQRRHSGIGMTPLAKWSSCRAPRLAPPSPDVLRFALSKSEGTRRVGKRGVVWRQGRYWADSLNAWMDMDVMVRRDEDELGELYIFAPDGSFIDVAVDFQRAGISEQQFAEQARRNQAKYQSEQRADLRAMTKRYSPEKARDDLLRAEAEAAANVTFFPGVTVPSSTPAIDSITDAVAASPARPAPPTCEPSAPRAPVASTETPERKMLRIDRLIARHEAGDTSIDPAELRAARGYQTTSEYKAQKAMAQYVAGFTTKASD